MIANSGNRALVISPLNPDILLDLYHYLAAPIVMLLSGAVTSFLMASQWVIGQNVTSYGDICQTGSPHLRLLQANDENIALPLTRIGRLLYMPATCFGIPNTKMVNSLPASMLLQQLLDLGLRSKLLLIAFICMCVDTQTTEI